MRYALDGNYYNREKIRLAIFVILAFLCALATFFFVSFFISNASTINKYSFVYPSSNALINIPQNPGIEVGPATKGLIEKIKQNGLEAMAVKSITRRSFSVQGALITLGGDNISVFEYQDSATPLKEASNFQKRKDAHLYVSGNLIVYYYGQKSNVIASLDNIIP